MSLQDTYYPNLNAVASSNLARNPHMLYEYLDYLDCVRESVELEEKTRSSGYASSLGLIIFMAGMLGSAGLIMSTWLEIPFIAPVFVVLLIGFAAYGAYEALRQETRSQDLDENYMMSSTYTYDLFCKLKEQVL